MMAGVDDDNNMGGNLALVYALGVSLLVIVPWTLVELRGLLCGGAKGGNSRDGKRLSVVTTRRLIRLAVLACAWAVFGHFVFSVEGGGEGKFDPHEILQISSGATAKEIRKAYRALARVHHPDYHGGDAKVFARIAKAYEALTDPVAMGNYRKYGHPDGYQRMSIGVGLPEWLTDGGKSRGGMVLAAYFSIFVGIFTILGYKFTKNSSPHESAARLRLTEEDVRHLQRDLFSKKNAHEALSTARIVSAIMTSPRFLGVCSILRKVHSAADIDASMQRISVGAPVDDASKQLDESLRGAIVACFGPLISLGAKRSFLNLAAVLNAKRELHALQLGPKSAPAPKMSVNVTAQVLGEDEICAGDLVTFTFSVELSDAQVAEEYPFACILASPSGKVLGIDFVPVVADDTGRAKQEFQLQCAAPKRTGIWTVEGHVRSLCISKRCDAMKTLSTELQDPPGQEGDDEDDDEEDEEEEEAVYDSDNNDDSYDWVDMGDANVVDRARASAARAREERTRARIDALLKTK